MENLRLISLFINGLTLALALAFLIIVLWFYNRKPLLQSFSLFLIAITFWHSAALMAELVAFIELNPELGVFFSLLSDIGFASSSIGLYVFVSSLIVAHTRWLRVLAFLSLAIILLNNFIILQNVFESIQPDINTPVGRVSFLYFLLFDMMSLYLILRYRRKIRSVSLMGGLLVFIGGQGLVFLNPELGIVSFALLVSAIATVVMSFSMVRLELIEPLDERVSQVETIQQISLSIMQRNRLHLVVDEATQAVVRWLDASAAIVFLVENENFHVASTYRIPVEMVFSGNNSGVARETYYQKKPLLYENYARDWHGGEDFYLANETVGSVMSVPLFSDGDVQGVLLVISGQRGKVFDENDLRLLGQLSNQVAVAISHSQLFESFAEALDQLQVVLTSTDNPVIALDRKLRIIFINPNASAILSKVLDDNVSDIISGIKAIPASLIPNNIRDLIRQVRANGFCTYEYDFDSHIYLGRIAPLGSSKIDGWVAVLNDITDLIELDRMKSEMVRMTSHDLKNPLQAALANLDLLREDIDPNNQEAIVSLNLIEKQLAKMSRIISGILDLERIKLGYKIYNESIDLWDLLSQVIEEIEDYAEDNKIQITRDFECLKQKPIIGDFQQLKRVFVNLVENAIKFTPEEGHVWILGHVDNKKLTVSVKDNGVGIPDEIRERIFERFFRGQQDQFQHVSGSGLGLSFVKSIVENHQGAIILESTPNEGSCFKVMFDRVE